MYHVYTWLGKIYRRRYDLMHGVTYMWSRGPIQADKDDDSHSLTDWAYGHLMDQIKPM
jgi:hypothetical protein